jgi:alkyl hydroperoxide reductase subunit D
MHAIDDLRAKFPEYAKDVKLNLQSVLTSQFLTTAQVYGVALAAACASRNDELMCAVRATALSAGVSRETVEDAQAAAVLMAMNNVYYRFKHMVGDDGYAKMPAKLRMNRLANVAGSKVDFELFSLAVSAINGCENCIRAHERTVREGGVTMEGVHDAIRIAATMASAALVLDL